MTCKTPGYQDCGNCDVADCVDNIRTQKAKDVKHKIVKVFIERAEGPAYLCKKHEWEGPDSIYAAQIFLNSFQGTYPSRGGYDKHDVVLTWDDGATLAMRMDCMALGCENNDLDIREHLKMFVGFMTGIRKPDHMPEDRYRKYIEKDKDKFIAFAQSHECGVES
jgi:hypothetical protein